MVDRTHIQERKKLSLGSFDCRSALAEASPSFACSLSQGPNTTPNRSLSCSIAGREVNRRYADNPALLGIELLNEPCAAAVPIDILVSYYKSGYQLVRTYSSTAYVIVCQRIGNADPMELYKANIGDINVVVDVHYYNLFDTYFNDLNPLQNMQFNYNIRRPQLQAVNIANGPLVFIGEWVNEWNVTNASRMEYQIFGRTQLEVYDTASFGWSYWTLKNEDKHWDFEWSVKNKYLVLSNSWKNGISSCATLAVTFWAIILAFYGSLVL